MHAIHQSFHRGPASAAPAPAWHGQLQFPPQQMPFSFNAFPHPHPNPHPFQQNPNFLPHLNPIPPNYTGFPQNYHHFPNNTYFPVRPTHPNGHGNHQPLPPLPLAPPPPLPQHGDVQKEKMVETVDKAVQRARRDLLASNENVSAWLVSVAALGMVKIVSWESLGFQMHHVPSLNRLLATEGKINAFIHCFVAARRISSLYDLEMAICENEGVEHFEELELGPLVRHPLAIHYYSVTSDVNEAYRIRTEDIIFHLCELIDNHKEKEITIDDFLDFIATKLSVSVRDKLCIRIKNLGMCIQHIQKAKQSEDSEVEKYNEKLRTSEMKSGGSNCEPKSDEGGVEQPLISVQEKELDNHYTNMSEGVKSSSSAKSQFCGKHTRFRCSSSDDDNTLEAGEYDNDQNKYNTYINPISLPSFGLNHVSACSYPSATEERNMIGLKNNVDASPPMRGRVSCNSDKKPRRKRRNVDIKNESPDHRGIISPVSPELVKMCAISGKEACQVTNSDEVISRETVYYGASDNSFICSLLNWALPYAQRYIYRRDPDKYLQLKDPEFHGFRNLKIFVVGKLYCWTLINKHKTTLSKRKKCSCLLQDGILYCKKKSDRRALFLGLSCLFYSGKPQFLFADFLHVITSMAELGKTKKQIEKFILKSLKMPKLPSNESCWTILNLSSLGENGSAPLEIQITKSSYKRKSRTSSNRLRKEPEFSSPSSRELKKLRANNDDGSREHNLEQADPSPKDCIKEVSIEVDPSQTEITSGPVYDTELSGSKSKIANVISTSSSGVVIESVDHVGSDSRTLVPSNSDRDLGMAQQAIFTGRLGELVAFKYFAGKEDLNFVKWVNEIYETGLPYDIVLGDDEEKREYIEVKSTISSRKDWFEISVREWQFAFEKGEAFSIAHVVFTENNMAKVTIYKNPARLLQIGNLKLAIVVPKQ